MVDYLAGIVSDQAAISGIFSDGPELRRLAVAGVLWILVFWLLRRVIQFFFQTRLGHNIVKALTAEQREAFDMWVMELIVSTISLIVFICYSSNIFVYGTFNTGFLTDTPETDWRVELTWIREVRSVTACWAYSIQPVIFLYLFEIVCVSPARSTRVQHHLIIGHHLMSVLLLVYGYKATSSTFNGRWVQMGYACFLHMICEQQTWIALIWYRLKLRGYAVISIASVCMEITWRLFLWSWCFYVYSQLTFAPCTFTMWEVIWRIAFPPTAMFLMLAQCATIRIHVLMALKSYRLWRAGKIIINEELHNVTMESATSPTFVSVNHQQQQPHVTFPTVAEEVVTGANKQDKEPAATKGRRKPFKMPLVANTEIPGYSIGIAIVTVIVVLFGLEVIGMDSSIVEVRCKRIAIVGGGVSGLGAAWSLSRSGEDFTVDVFESRERLGGAANSVVVNGHATDTAFTAMLRFHNVELLLEELGVEVGQTSAGNCVVAEDERGERFFFGNSISSNLANKSAAVSFADDIERFTTLKFRDQNSQSEHFLMTTTLDEYLSANNFSLKFRHLYIPACLQSYIAASVHSMLMPIGAFFWLEDVAGGCLSLSRIPYRYVKKGVSEYVKKLAAVLRSTPNFGVFVNRTVAAIKRPGGREVKLLIETKDSPSLPEWRSYDQVIFANFRVDVLKILLDPRSDALPAPTLYATALGHTGTAAECTYQNYSSMIHNDVAVMERQLRGYQTSDGCWDLERYSFYVRLFDNAMYKDPLEYFHMLLPNDVLFSTAHTCYRNLSGPFRVGVKHNPFPELTPDPSLIVFNESWNHVALDVNFFRSSRALYAVQGAENMWFAGGSCSINLHEPALASGLVVAEALGAPYPFDANAGARSMFVRQRNWMRFGMHYIVPPNGKRRKGGRRCSRCV